MQNRPFTCTRAGAAMWYTVAFLLEYDYGRI